VTGDEAVPPASSDSTDGHDRAGGLERSYRRLLRAYPRSYRAEREEELVGVLLDGATPGQRRPTVGDAVDLARGGLAARWHSAGRWSASDPWAEAGRLAGIVLAVLLAAGSMRIGVAIVRTATSEWDLPLPAVDLVGQGWYAPAAWLVVVLLLAVGWTRAVAVAAWAAVAVRVVSLVDLASPSEPAWASGSPSVALPHVPYLVIGLAAAVLLSQPARLRSTIGARSRVCFAAAVVAILVLHALAAWFDPRVGWQPWTSLASFALLGWWAVGASANRLARLRIGARTGALLLIVAGAFTVGRSTGVGGGVDPIGRRDLVVNLGVGALAVLAGVVAVVALVAVVRRSPFRLVRRP
jgi:hypothetical protein